MYKELDGEGPKTQDMSPLYAGRRILMTSQERILPDLATALAQQPRTLPKIRRKRWIGRPKSK